MPQESGQASTKPVSGDDSQAPGTAKALASCDVQAEVVGVPSLVGVPVHGKNQDARKAFQYQYSVASAWWQRWYHWSSRTQPQQNSGPWNMHPQGPVTSVPMPMAAPAMQPKQGQQGSTSQQRQPQQADSGIPSCPLSEDDKASKPSAPCSDAGDPDDSLDPMSTLTTTGTAKPTAFGEQKVCKNCGTDCTPFWRKDKSDHQPLCNACGLYAAKNGSMRPAALWKIDEHQQQHQPYPGCPNTPPEAPQATAQGTSAVSGFPDTKPTPPDECQAMPNPAAPGFYMSNPFMGFSGSGPSAQVGPVMAAQIPTPALPAAAPISSTAPPAETDTVELPSAAELLTVGLENARSGARSASVPPVGMPQGTILMQHPNGTRFVVPQYPMVSFPGAMAPGVWRPQQHRRSGGKSTLPPLPAKLPASLKTQRREGTEDREALVRTQSMPAKAKGRRGGGGRGASLDLKRASGSELDHLMVAGELDEPAFDPAEIDELLNGHGFDGEVDGIEEGGCESGMFAMDKMGLDNDEMECDDDALGSSHAHPSPVGAFGSL